MIRPTPVRTNRGTLDIRSSAALALLCLAGLLPRLAAAVEPANDHFANRIPLTGSSWTVTASLAEATREIGEWPVSPDSYAFYPTRTLWWSWTADANAEVTVIVAVPASLGPFTALIGVWTNNYAGFPTNYQPASPYAGLALDGGRAFNAFNFQAETGRVYHFQVAGLGDLLVTLTLRATQAPYILVSPQSRTALPGESVLFSVVTTALRPVAYQWLYNDEPLPNEHGPQIALTNVAPEQAGEYRVSITSAFGSTTSSVAHLWIPLSQIEPRLAEARLNADRFTCALFAETGRSYRVWGSVDLNTWTPTEEFTFAKNRLSSVVVSSEDRLILSVPRSHGARYLRVAPYQSPNTVCIHNLKALRHAKDLWAFDLKKNTMDTPQGRDMPPYLPGNKMPACPQSGYYQLFHLGGTPRCTIPEHILEEPSSPIPTY